MKKRIAIICLITSGLFLCAYGVMIGQTQKSDKTLQQQEQIERGKYLVQFSACQDCHSPKLMGDREPVPDQNRMLSGAPSDEKIPSIDTNLIGPDKWGAFCTNDMTIWVGPWGISYSANLTPHEQTGIGLWTEELFVKTLKNGKHLGTGRPLLPPMPWNYIGTANDKDLKAIFAYLRTLKPVRNAVPTPVDQGKI